MKVISHNQSTYRIHCEECTAHLEFIDTDIKVYHGKTWKPTNMDDNKHDYWKKFYVECPMCDNKIELREESISPKTDKNTSSLDRKDSIPKVPDRVKEGYR